MHILPLLQQIYEHRIIVSNTFLSPVVYSNQETNFLLLQLTSTIEYLTDPPSCIYTTLCLVCQQNTMELQVVFPIKASLGSNHHVRGAMIPSFLPEHVQNLNYNQWNLLPSQIHAKGNCRE